MIATAHVISEAASAPEIVRSMGTLRCRRWRGVAVCGVAGGDSVIAGAVGDSGVAGAVARSVVAGGAGDAPGGATVSSVAAADCRGSCGSCGP